MRVVADSHTIVWYVQDSGRLGSDAAAALDEAEVSDGIVVTAWTRSLAADGAVFH